MQLGQFRLQPADRVRHLRLVDSAFDSNLITDSFGRFRKFFVGHGRIVDLGEQLRSGFGQTILLCLLDLLPQRLSVIQIVAGVSVQNGPRDG